MEHILLFLQGKFSIGYRVSQKKHSYKNFWTRDHTLHLLADIVVLQAMVNAGAVPHFVKSCGVLTTMSASR